MESILDAALDSGNKRDNNILIFRHPKDSPGPDPIGRHPIDLVTDSVQEIYERIELKTGNVIIAGAPHYGIEVAELADALVRSNRNVFLSGPNLDINGQPYGSMPALMTLADNIILTKAPCYKNGCRDTDATRSAIIDDKLVAVCAYHSLTEPSIAKDQIGSLKLYLGVMFSGKSKRWVRALKKLQDRGVEPIVIRPLKANRYGEPEGELFSQGHVTLNDKSKVPAILIDSCENIKRHLSQFPEQKYLFIDEVQFFKGIYQLQTELIAEGYHTACTGLPRGFNRKGFGEVPALMCLADSIEISYATCVGCGRPATDNQRMKRENGKVVPAHTDDLLEAPGGKDSEEGEVKNPYFYEARCLDQWILRGEPKNKFELARYVG